MLHYWETFESNIYDGKFITPSDLYRLTRLTSITRERARIQNVYKLFQAKTKFANIVELFQRKRRKRQLKTDLLVILLLQFIWMKVGKMGIN